jgi:hypothetical protein
MNSTYHGLVNSLLSQLGLNRVRCLRFTVRPDLNKELYGTRAILKTDNSIIFCSRFANLQDYTADYSIELCERPYLTIYQVYELVKNHYDNHNGLYDVELISQDYPTTGVGTEDYWKICKAFTLLNDFSQVSYTESLAASTKLVLKYQDLIPHSLQISDNIAFRTEVYDSTYLTTPGYYFVNYDDGYIQSFSEPGNNINIRYSYHKDDMDLYHVPVNVSSLITAEAKKYLFEEIEQFLYTNLDVDSEVPGHPKKFLIDLVEELMSVSRIYWGT